MSGGTTIEFIGDLRKKEFKIDVALVCPWCDVASRSESHILSETKRKNGGSYHYAFAVCQSRSCNRPVFLVVEDQWGSFYSRGGVLKAAVFPSPTADYAPDGVPDQIAEEFREALECQWAGHSLAAALVGRRVLQAACRDALGGKRNDLKTEIEEIPIDRLNKGLKDQATHVRFIGNDAAHVEEVDPDDVDELLDFVEAVLDALYIAPHRVAQMTAKRDAKKAAKGKSAAAPAPTPGPAAAPSAPGGTIALPPPGPPKKT